MIVNETTLHQSSIGRLQYSNLHLSASQGHVVHDRTKNPEKDFYAPLPTYDSRGALCFLVCASVHSSVGPFVPFQVKVFGQGSF